MTSKLAVQMFTLREHTSTAAALSRTFQRIRAIGYEAVQLCAIEAMNGGNPRVDAQSARRMLDDNGLRCIGTHRSWTQLNDHTEAEIAFHQILGCDFTAIGGIPNAPQTTPEAYRTYIRDADALITRLRPAGIRFAHHNHAHEFFRPERGGKTLADILIDEAPAELFLELDVYWIQHAGANSERLLERCHGRVPVIHIKDREVVAGTDDTRTAPVGEGNLDWPHIIPACEAAGVEWYCVEQDECHRDPFDCLKASYDFVRNLTENPSRMGNG